MGKLATVVVLTTKPPSSISGGSSHGSILSVGEDKYDIAGYCDRSDVAQLNIELEQNKIKK